jgi:DNA-binding FadR family transcriptional regulator
MMHKDPSLPSALKSTSLTRQVVDLLGGRIVSGEAAVGETLPNEADLQAELDVSRTVVREAVKILTQVRPQEEWNLLDPDVLRWQYESDPSREFLRNVVEVRRAIEVSAAELAAQRATQADIQCIRERYAALAASTEEDERYIEADLRFHEAIFKACRNRLMEQLALTLRVALQSSRKITVQIPGSSAGALPLHLAVVEAIAGRDAGAARQATHRLIDRSAADIDAILSQREKR